MRLHSSQIQGFWWRQPPRLRWLLASAALFFDSYFGMNAGHGLIAWSGVITGDFKWLLLSAEMMISGLILVRVFLQSSSGRWRPYSLALTPLLIGTLILLVLEFVLQGLGRSGVFNFNIASLGLSGMYWAAAYLSVAIGLTLTYKVQRFANFAQAEMMLVGSYVALTLMWSETFFQGSNAPKDDHISWALLLWAALAGFLVTGLFGLLIDKAVFKRLRRKAVAAPVMMIASLGIAMILRSLLFMRYGAGTHRFIPDRDWGLVTSRFEVPTERITLRLGERIDAPFAEIATEVGPYSFSYTKTALVVGVLVSVIFLIWILHRTRLGRQVRAVADNPSLAASSGIHVERIHGISAFLSAGISGLGGALLAAVLPINPELGISLLLPAFAVIVLGSIGSIPGALLGALIVGLIRAMSEPLLTGAGNALDRPTAGGFAEVVPFIVLVGLLLLAPRGLGEAIHQWNITRARNGSQPMPSSAEPSRLKHMLGMVYLGYARAVEGVSEAAHELLRTIRSAAARTTESIRMPSARLMLSHSNSAVAPLRKRIGHNLHLRNPFPFSRDTERGAWIAFAILLIILLVITWLLPSVSNLTKTLQIARVAALVGIFGLMSLSLNLHTGMTGMTNFGVIFFVGIGAVMVGLLAAPVETNGHGWSPLQATLLAVVVAAAAGWLLAYPTARLRVEYFAIVTISLGEMLRVSLQAEPMLRAGTVTSAMGISKYARPLESWWEGRPADIVGSAVGLEGPAPYVVLLALMALAALGCAWFLLNVLFSSPWGRILRSIREDEEVSQHHGHNILTHKAASLALGAAIAALGGALWAWLNTSIFPDFMNPVRSTFLVWAAFIVGGKGNNRGMIIGAFLIVIVEFVFNVMVVSRGNSDLILHGLTSYLDGAFSWLVVSAGGLIWSARSISETFPSGEVLISLPHLKLALVGAVIVGALLLSPRGLLPEVPVRPRPPSHERRAARTQEAPND